MEKSQPYQAQPVTRKRNYRLPYRVQMRFFLLPYLLGTLILVVIPAVATALISFTEYKAVGTPKFVGLQNYIDLLSYDLVRIALRNSAIFLILAVPLRIWGAAAGAVIAAQGAYVWRVPGGSLCRPPSSRKQPMLCCGCGFLTRSTAHLICFWAWWAFRGQPG
ncbi:MAG: hypothetical protein M5U34_30815 [Chloroflexi bacterium]|nr:hypothetical protein [Chloroflexota bacterium]